VGAEESQYVDQQQYDSHQGDSLNQQHPFEGETEIDEGVREQHPAVHENLFQHDQDHAQIHEQEHFVEQQQQQQEYDYQGEDDAPNDLEALQLQREREFMAYLCDGLDEQVPAEYAQHIEADLSERLRQTVRDFTCQ
jgi:hypothetical protein